MGNSHHKSGGHSSKDTESQSKLVENFKVYSGNNGELSLSQFIQALSSIDEFKDLGNSPLSERLFQLFDKDKSGRISQAEYLAGLQEIISSDEAKIKYTFLAFDKDCDDMVSLSEFVETFQEAWVQAFTLLQEAIKKRTSYGTNPRISLIQEWAIKNKQIVADKVMTEFSRYTSHDRMTFVQFREWVKTGTMKSVAAGFENFVFEIPLTLL